MSGDRWYLPLDYEYEGGPVFLTCYHLTERHSPSIREDSLGRWGLSPEEITEIKREGRAQWEEWRKFARIVSGARL